MSLTEPTQIEKLIAAWRASQYKRILLYAVLGLIALGIILYLFDAGGDYFRNRQRNAIQANVNAAMQDLANIKTNTVIDTAVEAQAVANAKIAVQEYQTATNATDEARIATNAALANLANANKNNVNISAADLEKKLEGIK